MSAWGDVHTAVRTAITAAGYVPSGLADPASLPSHTAGSEVVVTVDTLGDGAILSDVAVDAVSVEVAAIATGYTQAAAQLAALDLARALRVAVEDSATLRATVTPVYQSAAVAVRPGSTVAEARVIFTGYLTSSY